MYINWHHSIVQSFHYIREHSYIYTWRNSTGFLLSPCWLPFVSPLYPLLLTWHPPSCDRNRPPLSQVACKLTPFAPPFTQLSLPSQFPEPQLPSASLRRPREYSGSCYPEQVLSTWPLGPQDSLSVGHRVWRIYSFGSPRQFKVWQYIICI